MDHSTCAPFVFGRLGLNGVRALTKLPVESFRHIFFQLNPLVGGRVAEKGAKMGRRNQKSLRFAGFGGGTPSF
jgi:hypothetical protein